MQIKILKSWTEEVHDDFDNISPSFSVSEKDFADTKFPCYIVVEGSYSNHFDWSSWDRWEALPEEPEWLRDGHGGSIEEGCWISSPKEAVEFLNSFENTNYDDGSHSWEEEVIEFKITSRFFEKKGVLTNTPFYTGHGWYDQWKLSWKRTNTALSPDEEIRLYENSMGDKNLIEFFERLDLSWAEIAQEQIEYIKNLN